MFAYWTFPVSVHLISVASSSPIGYRCAKFRFCRTLCCWASSWRKIVYSITQSLTQLTWFRGNRSFHFEELALVINLCNYEKYVAHCSTASDNQFWFLFWPHSQPSSIDVQHGLIDNRLPTKLLSNSINNNVILASLLLLLLLLPLLLFLCPGT